jgi:putative ABC transport system substrate-binding protein
MKRREFIALLGAATACPLAARAQAMPVIGFLDSGTSVGMEQNLAGFHRGLGETGFVEGKNVVVEYRWAQGHYDRLPALAAELVRRPVAVIAATRSPAPALAAKSKTSTIPIVFQTGSDPVKDGIVASFNRPGGNVTGATRLTAELLPKRLGLMSDLVGKVTAVGLLVNPKGIQTPGLVRDIQEATRARGYALHIANVSNDAELDAAFASFVQSKVNVLIEGNDPFFIDHRKQIVAQSNRHAIPTMFFERDSVVAGGLISYSANFADSFRQVGVYVGRILKGAKPADLPVLQPTKFDLILNLKTARALGIEVPPGVMAIADEVIE